MPEPSKLKTMSVDEFHRLGYLQEANRQFFHPLGLALSVQIEDGDDKDPGVGDEAILPKADGFGEIWDYRDDPEGMAFGEPVDADKALHIAAELTRHRGARERLFEPGRIIQNVDEAVDVD